MAGDDRNLLEVLKFELDFLEGGGYGRSHHAPWRARLIFEDSPTCLNYNTQQDQQPCSKCVLMELVPPCRREQGIPCRHIPLTSDGKTLDYLYAYETQPETEEALRGWLHATIQRLEAEQKREEPSATTSQTNV